MIIADTVGSGTLLGVVIGIKAGTEASRERLLHQESTGSAATERNGLQRSKGGHQDILRTNVTVDDGSTILICFSTQTVPISLCGFRGMRERGRPSRADRVV